jgi:ribosomal protein S18 acetylase RimI-like enzyme
MAPVPAGAACECRSGATENVRPICYRIAVKISIATSVRRAQISDTAALTELVNRAYAVEAFFVDGQRTTAEEIASLIRSSGFLVLEHAGGIAAAVLFQPPGAHHGSAVDRAYFGMLAVLPELQGMGLGARLVRVAEAMAEASGATSMALRVINLREELRRWYKSLGYREIGTSPYNHRTVKRPCHFIEMAKPLTSVASVYTLTGDEIGAA